MRAGQIVTLRRTFSQNDFNRFAALSGDDNPIHVDAEFSARTQFGRTVAHGMLLYTTICGALHRHFPGTQHIEQDLKFTNPTYADEEITLRLEVLDVRAGSGRILTLMTRADGEPVCEGQTVMRLPEVA